MNVRRMLTRMGSAAEIIEEIGRLKAMNAQGNDIYMRPAGRSGLVLVDDLSAKTLQYFDWDGLTPTAVMETRVGNHQAWIRVSGAGGGGAVRSRPEWHRLATLRAAGGVLRIRRLEHTRADGQPYVRFIEARGGRAPAAAADVLVKA